jgi:hypothetical protein
VGGTSLIGASCPGAKRFALLPALALAVKASSATRRTAQWRRCIPLLSAASQLPLVLTERFTRLGRRFPQNGKTPGGEWLLGWDSCPAKVKSCARQRAICHMQFLPRLKRPRAQNASETTEAFAPQYTSLSAADRTYVVVEQPGSCIDEVGYSLVTQFLCSHAQQVPFGLPLCVTCGRRSSLKLRCGKHGPHERQVEDCEDGDARREFHSRRSSSLAVRT